VVRYDARGTGMSQRVTPDFSAEAAIADLTAIVDKLQLERFALYDHAMAGEGPMAFAAAHPGRVAAFVCWVGLTMQVVPDVLERYRRIARLQHEDWDFYCQIGSRLLWGWDSPEATPFATLLREGSSPEARRAALIAIQQSYENDWRERITSPSLLMHRADAHGSLDSVRSLASVMPRAHVLAVPGANLGAWNPDVPAAIWWENELMVSAVVEFVRSAMTDPAEAVATPAIDLSSIRALLWTDIENHTPLMQRLGDERGREVMREHERITREALATHGGAEVKAMGDGFMAWFPSANAALECAVALQRAFARRNESTAEPLRVRAAVNAGEPIAEDDDLFGAAVILASRICREASGGEIVVSDVVRQLVAGKTFNFSERGEIRLKGFDEPVRLFDVRWLD
jgi:class 3 adenylate cyclase/pimeloyl-ACP methyl ester carboxylesterase